MKKLLIIILVIIIVIFLAYYLLASAWVYNYGFKIRYCHSSKVEEHCHWFWEGYHLHKEKSSLTKDEITDWKTYRNEEYGFEVKFPKSWIDFEVRKEGRGFGPDLENDSLDFGLCTKDEKWILQFKECFVSLIWMNIHSRSQWATIGPKIQKGEIGGSFIIIGENDNYVFSWESSMIQGRGVIETFPPYGIPEDMTARRSEIQKILSTFKFTK